MQYSSCPSDDRTLLSRRQSSNRYLKIHGRKIELHAVHDRMNTFSLVFAIFKSRFSSFFFFGGQKRRRKMVKT